MTLVATDLRVFIGMHIAVEFLPTTALSCRSIVLWNAVGLSLWSDTHLRSSGAKSTAVRYGNFLHKRLEAVRTRGPYTSHT